MNLNNIDLYFITNADLTSDIYHGVEAALRAGVKIVQYREKAKDYDVMRQEALRIKEICRDKAFFIVNDNVDLALDVDADGVHIGQSDTAYQEAREKLGNEKIIGVSASSIEQAIKAYEEGADYLGVGPIFTTKSKTDASPPCGLELIRGVRKAVDIPIVAIGGITLENIASVIRAGAKSVAALSSILVGEDIEKVCKKFIKVINSKK